MSNQLSTQTISFYGSDLITLKLDDVIYTAVRPIVEALGLSWGSQQRKLENSKGKFSCTHMKTTGSDGKTYEMLCMPLKKLNGWLFSINPEKVRPDLKEKVIRYQEECFEALYNYWHFGKAERQQLALPEPEPTYSRTLTERQWLKFASLWFACYNNLELLGRIYPPLEALGSRLGVEAYTHCTEYRTTLEVMKRILEPMLAEFDVDPRKEPHYYRALRTLREFELKGLGAVVKI